jgi:methylated-DNA-[protein]-cysteine S-methyltransferase
VVFHATVGSPLGDILLGGDEAGLVGLWFANERPRARGRRDPAALRPAAEQLEAYFAGELQAFDLPLAPRGTAWQRHVWSELERIPFGETITYRELAARAGRPTAIRAAGHANGRNPISIVVPCHRVIGSTGSLTGYGGGIDRKRWLLAHEAAGRQA